MRVGLNSKKMIFKLCTGIRDVSMSPKYVNGYDHENKQYDK